MNQSLWKTVPLLLVFAAPLWAQNAPPHIGFVYPAGGRQGTTFEIKIGGEHLDGARALRISGDGVQAKVLSHTRPLTQRETDELRRKLQDLQKKAKKTDDDRKEIEVIRKKLAPPAVLPTPALAETVTVEITIDAKAATGARQLRLQGNTGMSNPVVFDIGRLPEITQAKTLVDPEAPRKKSPEIQVALPAALNSQIMAGGIDRYRFSAREGQHLMFITHARLLVPYLADAVPGWFQAVLTLYDSDGNEVAYADHFHFHPDPVLHFKVPKDGDYVLEVRDALYRGREDFVYRIEVGELPFVTSIFPLGGPAKTRTTVTLEGWNLPVSNFTTEPAAMKPGIIPLSVRKGDHESNSIPFGVGTLPECLAQPDIHTFETSQAITLPIVVNGRIAKAGRWDVFKFEGRKGQAIVAEVKARRLGSPLDSVIKLTDGDNKVLAYNDDFEDKGQGLITHHADSQFKITLPSTGTFYLYLGDAQSQGSPAHGYRLRVSSPHPDFELRVTPCSINAQPGSTVPITVHALRRDGFTGEISLALTYAPVDFVLTGAKVPANQDSVRVTLQVPATIRPKPINLVIEGRAIIGTQKVVHVATPAEEMMQAFIYHHLVPSSDLMVTVSGQARARFPAQILHNGPVKIRPGGTASVRIAFPNETLGNKIKLVLSDPPNGITLKSSQVFKDGAVLVLHADDEKATPGMRANLIIEAFPEAGGGGGKAARPLGTLPAISFEIPKIGR